MLKAKAGLHKYTANFFYNINSDSTQAKAFNYSYLTMYNYLIIMSNNS